MSSGQVMIGRGGFDPVCGFVERIVESVASFVFFHALGQGSVGLPGNRYTWRGIVSRISRRWC